MPRQIHRPPEQTAVPFAPPRGRHVVRAGASASRVVSCPLNRSAGPDPYGVREFPRRTLRKLHVIPEGCRRMRITTY